MWRFALLLFALANSEQLQIVMPPFTQARAARG